MGISRTHCASLWESLAGIEPSARVHLCKRQMAAAKRIPHPPTSYTSLGARGPQFEPSHSGPLASYFCNASYDLTGGICRILALVLFLGRDFWKRQSLARKRT